MLNRAKKLQGYKVHSLDGEIGSVKEFYFDDQFWTIRYLIINTGSWLKGRQVLISPHALGAVNEKDQYFDIDLTKKQIEDSPPLDSDKPVSQQFEGAYFGYYGWPVYWRGPHMCGQYPYIVRDHEVWREHNLGEKTWDPHLRSTLVVSGYDILATDGEIGRVDDFVVDDQTWAIRYLSIDTGSWWPEKKTLIPPQWIERIDSRKLKVFVNLLRETIKQSPEYTNELLLSREYENTLYQHYNRKGYWVDESISNSNPVEVNK